MDVELAICVGGGVIVGAFLVFQFCYDGITGVWGELPEGADPDGDAE